MTHEPLVRMDIRSFLAWTGKDPRPGVRLLRQRLWQLRVAIGTATYVEDQLHQLMLGLAHLLTHHRNHTQISHPILVLIDGRAWCDQYAAVFSYLVCQFFGLASRRIRILHSDGTNGHFTVEVYYSGGWHFFDPHSDHLSVYRDPHTRAVLSYDELVACPEIVAAEKNWFVGEDGIGKEGFFTGPPTSVNYCWQMRPKDCHFDGATQWPA